MIYYTRTSGAAAPDEIPGENRWSSLSRICG